MNIDAAKEVSKRFKLLCNADPRLYDQLLSFVQFRMEEIVTAVTEAPADKILVAQGRAQEARKFFQLMTEFPPEQPQPQQGPAPVIPPAPGP